MLKPKLLVEALAAGNDSGLGRHVRLFLQALEPLAQTHHIEVILRKNEMFKLPHFLNPIYVQAKPFRLWTQIIFPFLIWRKAPKGVLCLGQTLPWWKPHALYILLIADVAPLEKLGWRNSKFDNYNRNWLRKKIPQAQALITSTQFTQQRIRHLFTDAIPHIAVIPPNYKPMQSHKNITFSKTIFSVPFLLGVGNIEPRKNFPLLVKAFAGAKKQNPTIPDLFIVGNKAWGLAELEQTIQTHAMQNHVHLLGYIEENLLWAYYAQCTLFISSSLYEGFGFPLYEALTQGKACIYHDASSQAEFAQGLALGINCADEHKLAEAIMQLWNDETLRHHYQHLASEGMKNIATDDLPKNLCGYLTKILST